MAPMNKITYQYNATMNLLFRQLVNPELTFEDIVKGLNNGDYYVTTHREGEWSAIASNNTGLVVAYCVNDGHNEQFASDFEIA